MGNIDRPRGTTSKTSHNGTISSSELVKSLEKKSFTGSAVISQIRFLAGEILTIIDASFQEGPQKKAIKDLIKNSVAQRLSFITELASDHRVLEINDEELKNMVEVEPGEDIV